MTDERGPAIDVDALGDLEQSIGDDPEFLRELVETYLDDAPKQIEQMRDGLAGADVELVNRSAHTLKSNSSSVGALVLSQMSRELEAKTQPAKTSADDLANGGIAGRIEEIAGEFERVRRELDALVPQVAS